MRITTLLLALPLTLGAGLALNAASQAQTTTVLQTTHDDPMPAAGLLATTHSRQSIAPDGTRTMSDSTTYTHTHGTTTTDSKTVIQTPAPPPTTVIVR